MDPTAWNVVRLGRDNCNIYTLHPHMPEITLGRSVSCHIQAIDPFVSRHHLSFIRETASDSSINWRIRSVSQTGNTFLNKIQLPTLSTTSYVNDGDLLSVGTNVGLESAHLKQSFLYRLKAPVSSCSNNYDCDIEDTEFNATQVAPSDFKIPDVPVSKKRNRETLVDCIKFVSDDLKTPPCPYSKTTTNRESSFSKRVLLEIDSLMPTTSASHTCKINSADNIIKTASNTVTTKPKRFLLNGLPSNGDKLVDNFSCTDSQNNLLKIESSRPNTLPLLGDNNGDRNHTQLCNQNKECLDGNNSVSSPNSKCRNNNEEHLMNYSSEFETVSADSSHRTCVSTETQHKTLYLRNQKKPDSCPRPLLRHAEVKIDSEGRKHIAKMTFKNQLCNVFSQEIVAPSKASLPKMDILRKLGMNNIWDAILSWKVKWLQQQMEKQDLPPVECGLGVCHVPAMFKNVEEYRYTFVPLMLYELWAQISSEPSGCPAVPFELEDFHQSTDTFSFIINVKNDSYVPQEDIITDGYLVCVGVRDSGERFGYIQSSRWSNKQLKATDRKGLRLTIQLRATWRKTFDALRCSTIYVKKLYYIKSFMRMFQALFNAEKSSLFLPLVVNHEHRLAFVDKTEINVNNKALNEEQREAVKGAVGMILESPDRPNVTLIHGPPGTGKTKTIVAIIILLILKQNSHCPRILLTAPSNAAVDEICKKLIKFFSDQLKHIQFNFVRVGREESVDNEVQPYLLENLVRYKRMPTANAQSVELAVKHHTNRIAQLEANIKEASSSSTNQIERWKRRLTEQRQLLDRAKSCVDFQETTTDQVLFEADIIATTLGSSMNGAMRSFFVDKGGAYRRNKGRPFAVCIVDEASQCIEPDLLMPLRLGFNKLLMVGDHEQLSATVCSKKARDLSLNVSTFSRLYNYYDDGTCRPQEGLHHLRQQYRMHPQISKWPGEYFYGGTLKDGRSSSSFTSIYLPYLLINFTSSAERMRMSNKSFYNPPEALLAAKIAYHIAVSTTHNVGVISFYSSQVLEVELYLKRYGPCKSIRVCSVDGFQGGECDFIVITCVRSNKHNDIGFVSDPQRINVALTRAKLGLYVIGSFETFKGNDVWKSLLDDAERRKLVRTISDEVKDISSLIS